jgi:hypothetical protein
MGRQMKADIYQNDTLPPHLASNKAALWLNQICSQPKLVLFLLDQKQRWLLQQP